MGGHHNRRSAVDPTGLVVTEWGVCTLAVSHSRKARPSNRKVVGGRGRYGKNVRKALEYVLSRCTQTGFISDDSKAHGPMYGHGFATLFLAEVYGMTHNKQLREKLEKAVRLIRSLFSSFQLFAKTGTVPVYGSSLGSNGP